MSADRDRWYGRHRQDQPGGQLARDVAPSFERVYWRSLRDAPPLSDWLAGAIGFLSDQQLVPPPSESERLGVLLQLLRERRCLLVLDNSETLFEPGQGRGAIGPVTAGTVACCRRWPKPRTRAAWC